MKQNPPKQSATKPISWRPEAVLGRRFLRVVKASKRTMASIIHESLEDKLPILEKKHHKELRALEAQSA